MSYNTCACATTANLAATYDDTPALPTLTMNATGVLTLDGIQVFLNDVVLVKNQSGQAENGIFYCTTEGALGVNAVLSRVPGLTSNNDLNSMGIVVVVFGVTQALSGWILSSPLVPGFDLLIFLQVVFPRDYPVPTVNVTAATYIVLSSDYYLYCDRTGTIAITLTASPRTGRIVVIKDNSGAAAANNITITPAAGNIDGAANYVINTNYGSVTIIYNGTQWNIV